NNEISEFGYGVVSLGIGPLYYSNQAIPFTGYKGYYNNNNIIKGNAIYNVSRAGIFVGSEKNTSLNGNRIYNVIGSQGGDAAGIIAGGDEERDWFGYNNMNLKINGNEISDIHSSVASFGIKIQQSQINFNTGSVEEPVKYFPDGNDNLTVINNTIWGLKPDISFANKAGIYITTERAFDDFLDAKAKAYFMKGIRIANNTIVIDDDFIINRSYIAGIAMQNVTGALLKNNAVAVTDQSIDNTSDAAAAVIYQGINPKEGGLISDRNAFWLGASGAALFRFIQTDNNSNVLEYGSRNEFTKLQQWHCAVSQDINSVYGDFVTNLSKAGNSPFILRVTTIPEAPIGSILNNRGERLDFVEEDIDGSPRGDAGQKFDIGSDEFDGRMYVNDLELSSLPYPAAYRETEGILSDAEYIMTKAPVDIKANIRNNGSLEQSNVDLILDILIENPDGSFNTTQPVLSDTVKVSVQSGETKLVDFYLDDHSGREFYPRTYSDLKPIYNNRTPKRFTTMEANVTPRYKFRLKLASDQYAGNNESEKEVRYYLVRSTLSTLISTENSAINLYGNPAPGRDEKAGKLNNDSIMVNLNRLGWKVELNVEPKRYDIDLFDRIEWEPRSVDYSYYRSMFWADGDDKPLSRYQKENIENFMKPNPDFAKKNFIAASQELLRDNDKEFPDFTQNVLRASVLENGINNPLGNDVDNNLNYVKGINIGKGIVDTIKSTEVAGDAPPFCAVMDIFNTGEGLARTAFDYGIHTAVSKDSVMGVVTTSINSNVVYFGVDWRHFGDVESIIRAVADYMDKNGGLIIPVELLNFDAAQRGMKVELGWTTASENGSSHFEIERANLNEKGKSDFINIASQPAAGKSGIVKNYGPVYDYDVKIGDKYIYRLKMLDLDGSYEYSQEKAVEIAGAEGSFSISPAMPNPAATITKFELTLLGEQNISIELIDMLGRTIRSFDKGLMNAGTKTIDVDVSDLASGMYALIIKSGDAAQIQHFQVVK
ncbi:MAG: type sorting protein, partial [Bacteroidota bacterium]|nr:type sorting protein [Bacteroidota bacterium]